MPTLVCEVDTSQFEQMCNELSHVIGQPRDEVFREEVGRVLSQAIANTPVADDSKIKRDAANSQYAELSPTAYTPKRKTRRVHPTQSGRLRYKLSNRYPDALWQRIQKARAVGVAKRLAARGLAKQSFYKIALLLGLSVDVPNYVKRARPTTGKEYDDENVHMSNANAVIEYDIETSQPTLNAIGGEKALQKAIDGRTLYFVNNWARGVFNDMARVAKKYPGIVIQ